MEPLYGLLVFIMPILVVIILIQTILLNKKVNDLSQFDEQNVKALKSLRDKEILSIREFEEKVKKYKRKVEEQSLLELRDMGILDDAEYEQIVKKYKSNNSQALRKLREKLGDESIVCLPEEGETSWKCVCGTKNNSQDQNCGKCHLNKDFLFTEYKLLQ